MKIKKGLLSMALITSLCLQMLPVFGADNNFPHVNLDSVAPAGTLIDVWAGESKSVPALSTKAGKTGWITDITNGDSAKNIYCNVDDTYLFNNVKGGGIGVKELKGDAVEIEVEYYDASAGLFNIIYGSVNNTIGRTEYVTEAEYPVELTGTNTWKKHTFRLYDTRFANELNGADFLIRTYHRGDTTVNFEDVEFRNMYYKAGDIVFGSITVRKIPIVAELNTGLAGNIFTGTGNKQISVSFENTTDTNVNTSISYELVSCQTNETMWTDSVSATLYAKQTSKKILNIPFEKYGTFILKISTEADGNIIATEREYECSVIYENDASVRDDRFGVNTHLWESLWGGGAYTETLTDLVAKSGSGWIRDSVRWGDYEKSAGQYKIPDSAMNAIDTALSKGINLMLILHGTNKVYSGAETFPYTESVLDEFEKYCENLARDLKGKVETFETINEYYWQALGPDYYVKVLKATYNGVKRGNPNAKIVGFDLALVPISFIESVAQRGGLQYMDAVSVHPYSTSGNPDISPLIDSMSQLKNVINTYGNNQEIWISEIGWSNTINDWYTGNVIEDFTYEEAAAYQIKTYAHTIGRGTADRVIIYDFMNDNYDYGGKESNYGMIESRFAEEGVPFAAQPEYVSAAFMTNMLNNTIPDGYTLNNNNYKYTFKREDGSSVDVIWNTNENGSIDLQLPESGKTIIYDMYGNVIETLDNSSSRTYTQVLKLAPVYVEYKSLNPVYMTKDTILTDDFNGEAIDTGKWDNITAESNQVVLESGAVKLCDIYEHTGLGFTFDEPVTSGNINIKYDMYIPADSVDATTGKMKGEFILYGGSVAKDISAITWLNGGTLNVPGVGSVFTPAKETWYTVDVTLNLETRHVTVNATDGTKNWKLSGINKYTALSETSQILFGAKYLNINKSSILIDNVVVSREYEALKISYSIDGSKNEATVNAQLTPDDKGETASFIVLKAGKTFEDLEINPMDSLLYVSQGEVDENGLYSVDFKVPEETGYYNAYISFDKYDERYELDMAVGTDFAFISSVTQDGKAIKTLSDLDAAKDMKITVHGANQSGLPLKINLIYAFYNNGQLTDISINDIESDEEIFKDSVTAKGPLNNGKEFDRIKIFLWNSLDNIASLCKSVHLE